MPRENFFAYATFLYRVTVIVQVFLESRLFFVWKKIEMEGEKRGFFSAVKEGVRDTRASTATKERLQLKPRGWRALEQGTYGLYKTLQNECREISSKN